MAEQKANTIDNKPRRYKNTKKVHDYKAKTADLSINRSLGIYLYGSGGPYGELPNVLINAVDDSGTASTCIKRIRDFVFADGFTNKETASKLVNPKQRANQLLAEIANYMAYFDGAFCLRVLFDNRGNAANIYCEKLEAFRKREDGQLIYNRYMGTKFYRKSDDILIPEYDPFKSPVERVSQSLQQIKEHGKQLGEILYHFNKGAGIFKDIYPVPAYYSGLDDIEADAAISRLEKRNVKNGWKPRVIITMPPVDNSVKDAETGKTQRDLIDDDIQDWCDEDGADVIVIESKTKEEAPVINKFEIADIMDATEKATDRVGRKVCRHMSVPPVLIGFDAAAILGNQQALSNSLILFKRDISFKQTSVIDVLTMLMPGVDWSISKLDVMNYIADHVWNNLTENEIRKLGGYEPALPIDDVSISLSAMAPHVATAVMAAMTEDEVRALIGLKPKITEGAAGV